MMKRLLSELCRPIALLMMTTCMPHLSAQVPVEEVFIKAPVSVLPTIDTNTRLDMVDYFKGGMTTDSPTTLNGAARVTALDNRHIEFLTSDNGRIAMWPVKYGKDSVTVVVKTVDIPASDSRVELYGWPEWRLIDSGDCGVIADWVIDPARKEGRVEDVENALGFMTATASFDPASGKITYVPTVAGVITEAEFEKVAPYVQKSRTFKLKPGKGIVPEK